MSEQDLQALSEDLNTVSREDQNHDLPLFIFLLIFLLISLYLTL